MDAENKGSCLQRDSAERKGYARAHRSFNRIWKERDSAEPDILGKKPPCTERYARWCERTAVNHRLLLDPVFRYSSITSNIILAPSLKLFWNSRHSAMV